MRNPTLQDIAAETGLHPMTVSRALRNVGRMRAVTRRRVQEMAGLMGYRPDAAAAAMRTGRTGCVALITGARAGSVCPPPRLFAAVTSAVAAHGGYLAHATLPPDADFANTTLLPRIFGRRLADAVMLFDCDHDAPASLESFLRQNRLPYVWLGCVRKQNAVYADENGTARLATEQLLARGHRRIVFLQPVSGQEPVTPAQNERTSERRAGYERAMRTVGLAPFFREAALRSDELSPAWLKGFRKADKRPTAMLVNGDAPVVYARLLRAGLHVPQDVSLLAFTDCGLSAADQMVSHMSPPFEDLAREALAMLGRIAEAGHKPESAVVLPYEVVASWHTVRDLNG